MDIYSGIIVFCGRHDARIRHGDADRADDRTSNNLGSTVVLYLLQRHPSKQGIQYEKRGTSFPKNEFIDF